jgi:uncharacterized protein
MTPEERAAEVSRIAAAMIRQEFYIMHRRMLAPERKAAVVLEHFQWLVRMEKDGRLLMSGGIFLKDGTQSEGLSILRADSWDHAESLAASDPFVITGAASFHIERFRLGAGRITLAFDFSDRTYRLA